MASIGIVGESGTGKSTSMGNFPELGIEGLNSNESAIINVGSKDLPFKGWKKLYNAEKENYIESSDATVIVQAIEYFDKNKKIKNVVVDDAQFVMAFEFMARAKEVGFNKFADIGVNLAKILKAAKDTRPDLKVYFMWHPEKNRETGYKMKTVGAMVDNYLTLEGLFTIILYTNVSKTSENGIKYQFVTNFDGTYPSKSPVGLFKDLYIPNDLGFVSKAIDKYNLGE